jgi:parvulin-like peptidyl-prolyl isomerase
MVPSSTIEMLRSWSLRRLPVFAAAISLAGLAILGSPSRAQEQSSGQLTLQVIVVDSPDKARQILDRLRNGEDFAAVAKKESIDPSATEGGYLGPIDLSTLRPELRDALKGIEPGRMTGVIAVPSGYVILKVLPQSQPAGGQERARFAIPRM